MRKERTQGGAMTRHVCLVLVSVGRVLSWQ